MRRWLALYLCGLTVAAAAVFLTTYFLGRHSTLEAELERLTAPRPAPAPRKSSGIPSLQPAESPPEEKSEPQRPEGQPLGEGISVQRSALEPGGLAIIADVPALALSPAGDGSAIGDGLAAFLARTPAGLQIAVRALAGTAGECGAVDAILAPAKPGGSGRLALDVASSLGSGPRNPAVAAAAAVEDLAEVAGERAVVVLAGGEEGCSGDLCGAAPPPGGGALRVHVVLLAPPPIPGAEPGMPEAGTAAAPPPVFDPPWAGPYRCLAERSGGTLGSASSAAELEGALRRIAAGLESAVVVKGYHFTTQEIRGISPGGDAGWGASLRPSVGTEGAAALRESEVFPAAFAVPGGVYVLKAQYAGQERTAAVSVAPGERAEVRVSFPTGELFLQALDTAGREVVGDSTGFRCAWGAEVLVGEGEDAKTVASSCSFPARLELAPGSYRVRARWKGVERIIEEVTVEGGASAVQTVSFGNEDNNH